MGTGHFETQNNSPDFQMHQLQRFLYFCMDLKHEYCKNGIVAKSKRPNEILMDC